MTNQWIDSLLKEAIKQSLITDRDEVYVRNKLLALLQVDTYEQAQQVVVDQSIPQILKVLIEDAIRRDVIDDVYDEKEILQANIMDLFIDRPAVVEERFYQLYKENPKKATDYFYHLSKNSNYIQMEQINKNIHFTTESPYGLLDITINMSKPEKSSEQIAREKEANLQDASYPACVLCIDNEGYEGRLGYTARANHRMIQVNVNDEKWYFQYSPYIYYNEHSILLNEDHTEMKITRHTFVRLLAFVEQFPHYFIGANADLPIVGGSILSHDHYQAGRYIFPMEKAKALFTFILKRYPSVEAEIINWPLTVIRLKSPDKTELIAASFFIYEKWRVYEDEIVGIIPESRGEFHSTITPIARKKDNEFEMDIVLRNNRTTKEYPDGIFHIRGNIHHIKKENVGLIEVMGLAVLPARLKSELKAVKTFILEGKDYVAPYHIEWAKKLKEFYRPEFDIDVYMQDAIGKKFISALEDTNVFKLNKSRLKRFLTQLDVRYEKGN